MKEQTDLINRNARPIKISELSNKIAPEGRLELRQTIYKRDVVDSVDKLPSSAGMAEGARLILKSGADSSILVNVGGELRRGLNQSNANYTPTCNWDAATAAIDLPKAVHYADGEIRLLKDYPNLGDRTFIIFERTGSLPDQGQWLPVATAGAALAW